MVGARTVPAPVPGASYGHGVYVPPHFASREAELGLEVIERHGFATLVTVGDDGPYATHLPLALDRANRRLVGHVARANPQWRHFESGPALAIFHGPHGYVSPTWYEPRAGNVPTWNYVAVHVRGAVSLLSPDETLDVLRRLTAQYEPAGGYTVEATEVSTLVRAIVAFAIDLGEVITKLKLSQNRSEADRASVAEHLAASDQVGDRDVAAWMRR